MMSPILGKTVVEDSGVREFKMAKFFLILFLTLFSIAVLYGLVLLIHFLLIQPSFYIQAIGWVLIIVIAAYIFSYSKDNS